MRTRLVTRTASGSAARRAGSRLAIVFALVAACSAPPKKTNTDEGTNVPATCCCKTTPLTSEDAKPVYSRGVNRMECSTQQGTCVDDVQCNGSKAPPPTTGGDTPPPPPLEPSSSTLP